jgi:hypothetical protein
MKQEHDRRIRRAGLSIENGYAIGFDATNVSALHVPLPGSGDRRTRLAPALIQIFWHVFLTAVGQPIFRSAER